MITVMLIDMFAEVKILKYDTDSEEEACHLLIEDWKKGEIEWEFEDTNQAFDREWLEENGMDPISEGYAPEYENGVRTVEWYCCNGPKESDDVIAWGYFLHTTS